MYQDQIYAATWTEADTTSTVSVYNQRDGNWVKVHSFKVVLKGWVTLSVRNEQIKCCSASDSQIAVYSLSGELLQTHGERGRGNAGRLKYPYICTDDDDGSVLIADCQNNRLQVMSEQGEFSVLQLQPPVSQPRIAILFNNQLYMTSFWGQTLLKYI